MKLNIIINEDCIKAMNQLPENSIDLIFADPPYWMRTKGTLLRVEGTEFNGVSDDWDHFDSEEEYNSFTKKWLEACYRILKKDGSIWVIGGMQCIYTIGSIMQEIGFWLINDVIWHKKNPTPNFKGTRLTNSHETLIWATKSSRSKYTFNYKTAKELNTEIVDFKDGIRKQLGSVWRFSVVSGNERLRDTNGNKLHSTQKPLEMLYRIITLSSRVNDIVLDPFGGTMTTGVIAKQTGRNYIMIENNTEYCEIGQKRIDSVIPKINDLEKAIYDKKPVRVRIKEMIENGILFQDEPFYFKDGKTTGAKIKIDEKLSLSSGESVDIHTGAALLSNKKANRVNGFDYWYVKRDGNLISIKDLREQYRKTKENDGK
ncbi:DNA-methyltransferase [Ureaplasma canigenitalium]|uniref:DNA-methyltransferase n=1 Tax=Ureaplasma canigenitalium TaxID=42092 RepID=UPI0004E1DD55|nr:site-specific DNA-methyltransferase [Ureaplasma canigenitalium]